MKHFVLLPILAIIVAGCIKVEDAEDTGTGTEPVNPSSVKIQSGTTDFTLTWSKNTDGYGQLEITADPSVPKPVASAVNNADVKLDCTYVSPDLKDQTGAVQKKYDCTLENAGIIGPFPLIFPVEVPLEVIERAGKDPGDQYEVLSDFYIHISHGTAPEQKTVGGETP